MVAEQRLEAQKESVRAFFEQHKKGKLREPRPVHRPPVACAHRFAVLGEDAGKQEVGPMQQPQQQQQPQKQQRADLLHRDARKNVEVHFHPAPRAAVPPPPPPPVRSSKGRGSSSGAKWVPKPPAPAANAAATAAPASVPAPPPPPVRLGRWRGEEGQSIGLQPPAPMELVPPAAGA